MATARKGWAVLSIFRRIRRNDLSEITFKNMFLKYPVIVYNPPLSMIDLSILLCITRLAIPPFETERGAL